MGDDYNPDDWPPGTRVRIVNGHGNMDGTEGTVIKSPKESVSHGRGPWWVPDNGQQPNGWWTSVEHLEQIDLVDDAEVDAAIASIKAVSHGL